MPADKLTPMVRQYNQIKAAIKDAATALQGA